MTKQFVLNKSLELTALAWSRLCASCTCSIGFENNKEFFYAKISTLLEDTE